MSLAVISLGVRLFVLCWTIAGVLLASAALVQAHRNARVMRGRGLGLTLARARRSSEAWSLVAQTAFVAAGVWFILAPPLLPTSTAQIGPFVDGLYRMAFFGVGALALAVKSLLALVSEAHIRKSLP